MSLLLLHFTPFLLLGERYAFIYWTVSQFLCIILNESNKLARFYFVWRTQLGLPIDIPAHLYLNLIILGFSIEGPSKTEINCTDVGDGSAVVKYTVSVHLCYFE